jgi:septum formation protein
VFDETATTAYITPYETPRAARVNALYPFGMPNPLIYLASASPRRSALLTQIGISHRIQPVNVDESIQLGEPPDAYVTRLARAKAQALWDQLGDKLDERHSAVVLGSDTTVALDGEILGKPADRADGLAMLGRLSGRTHQVYTAVALQYARGQESRLSVSQVTFREIAPTEREAYWETGEPRDKAGGYAVQGFAAIFIRSIAGSYSGIVGLPLFETAELLGSAGLISIGMASLVSASA